MSTESIFSSLARSIYERLPVWAQNAACSARGRRILRTRYGPDFQRMLEWLKESQWWPYDKLREHQNHQLRKLIRHAYDTVPHYRKVMEARGLTPSDITQVEDLEKLPILTKDDVHHAGDEIVSRGISRSETMTKNTSGTTGAGLRFRVSSRADHMQWAVWWRHRDRFGLHLGDSHLNFGGNVIVPPNQSRPPFWRENGPLNQTYASIFHLKHENMKAYIDLVDSRNFAFFAGYPSAIYLLADHLIANQETLKNPPRYVVTGSETVLPFQAAAFEQAFGAKVADQYGLAEGCANLSQCQLGHYHDDMEFAVIEPIEIARCPEGRVCRIIGTSLYNYATPFIRYDTTDLGTFSDQPCPCGRASPFACRIDGRVDSYIITPDGRRIGRLACFKDMTNIKQMQLVQNTLWELVCRVVKRENYGNEDEQKLIAAIRKRVGNGLAVQVEYVDEIEKSRSGKFRSVISRIAKDHLYRGADIDAAQAKNHEPNV